MSKTAVRNRAHKEKRSFYKQHAKAPETRPQARGPRAEAGARGAGRAGRASEWRASAMSDYLHRLFGAQQRNLRPSIEQAQQSWDAREFCRRFGQDPAIAAGIFLRTWRSGEKRGQPKAPPWCRPCWSAAWPRYGAVIEDRATFFTESRMTALWQLLMDRRAMHPERFGHVGAELGLPVGS